MNIQLREAFDTVGSADSNTILYVAAESWAKGFMAARGVPLEVQEEVLLAAEFGERWEDLLEGFDLEDCQGQLVRGGAGDGR